MLASARIAVVIPAYNEEKWLAEAIRTIPDYVDIVVVADDASLDATSAVARDAGGDRVTVLRHATNRGVGAAIAAEDHGTVAADRGAHWG